jgi:hypothetical protein
MFRVLVPIFHLNYVTGELRLARADEIPLILLACIATAWLGMPRAACRCRGIRLMLVFIKFPS